MGRRCLTRKVDYSLKSKHPNGVQNMTLKSIDPKRTKKTPLTCKSVEMFRTSIKSMKTL